MNPIFFSCFMVSFVISWILNMVWIISILRYGHLLKLKYPKIYHVLGDPPASISELCGPGGIISSTGQPNGLPLSSIKAMFALLCFLIKKRYVKIHDQTLIKRSQWQRNTFFFALFSMLIAIIVLIMAVTQS